VSKEVRQKFYPKSRFGLFLFHDEQSLNEIVNELAPEFMSCFGKAQHKELGDLEGQRPITLLIGVNNMHMDLEMVAKAAVKLEAAAFLFLTRKEEMSSFIYFVERCMQAKREAGNKYKHTALDCQRLLPEGRVFEEVMVAALDPKNRTAIMGSKKYMVPKPPEDNECITDKAGKQKSDEGCNGGCMVQ